MKKKGLLELPVLELTEEMLANALSSQRITEGTGTGKAYDMDYYFRAAVENNILLIDVYLKKWIRGGKMEPAHRIFFDRSEPEFATFDTENKKWRASRIDNLAGIRGFWDTKLYMAPEEQRAVLDYLGLDRLERLEEWQMQIRKKQREAAIKRTTDRWDAVMEKIPGLPKDWKRWLAKDTVREHFMFYEYRKGGKTTGCCSRCGKEQILYRPRYNGKGICKSCRHPVIYKSVGKCAGIITRHYTAHLVQRMEGGVAARQFDTYAVYRKGAFDTPELSFWEGRRLILWKDGTAQAFYYGEYKDRKMHWIETKPTSYISPYYDRPDNCSRRGAVYRRTLPDLVRKELKKTGLLEMVRAQKYASPEEILLSVKEEPVLEKAAKAGLVTLAIDLMHSSCLFEFGKSGRLHQCLGIDRNQLKRLWRNQGGASFLKWLLYEKENGKTIADEVVSWFVRENIRPEDITFIADRMSPLQVMNYVVKQQKKMAETSGSSVLFIWRDYLRMAELGGVSTQDEIVYRAADLQKRHDDMVRLRERQKNEEEEKKILERYPALNEILKSLKGKYDYADGTYAVVVPESAQG